jgi:hypothetical protein
LIESKVEEIVPAERNTLGGSFGAMTRTAALLKDLVESDTCSSTLHRTLILMKRISRLAGPPCSERHSVVILATFMKKTWLGAQLLPIAL